MPPKGSGAAAVAAASVNWKVDVQGTQLKFTTFSPIGLLNGKNVAANFVKSDTQSYLTQQLTEEEYQAEREKKRRRLMASEDELQQATPAVATDGSSSSAKFSVLQAAPPGLVHPPKPTTPLDPDPDPLARTIVIHPGSSILRIGRASDAYPLAVPNVIARKTRPGFALRKPYQPPVVSTFDSIRQTSSTGHNHHRADPDDLNDDDDFDDDDPVPSGDELDPLSAKIASVRTTLRTRMRAYKLRGQGNGSRHASDYNATVVPERTEDYNDPDEIEWIDSKNEEVFVGEKALRIADPDAAGFVLRRPFDRGGFNTNGYASSQEFLGDIEMIWLKTLDDQFGITQSELEDYSCILIIPDLYDHVYVREMTDLVLRRIGFKQVILQQESICATFGAGISTACVVDIGAKVTSVTCVEEGLVSPESRMVLDFGGDDITAFLYTLLVRMNFPYRDADLSKWYDWKVLEDLKGRMVVLGEGDVGLNLYDFYVRVPGKPTRKYSLRSYDDAILAPYALFAPRVIDFDGKVQPQVALWSKGVEDNVDIGSETITIAMKNSTRHLRHPAPTAMAAPLLPDGAESSVDSPLQGTPGLEASNLHSAAGSPAPESALHALPKPTTASFTLKVKEPQIDVRRESSKIPLDVAIVESILATGAEDRIKKLSNNVLICGGTGMIHNIGFAVESRIEPLLVRHHPSLAGQVVVVPPPQEIDAKMLAWKGVSLLGKLDSANEMWVRQDEWDRVGMKAVRERMFYFA